MERITSWLIGIWAILAVAAFVCAFFVPVMLPRLVFIVFGIFNLVIIMSWIAGLIQARKEYKKNRIEEG